MKVGMSECGILGALFESGYASGCIALGGCLVLRLALDFGIGHDVL